MVVVSQLEVVVVPARPPMVVPLLAVLPFVLALVLEVALPSRMVMEEVALLPLLVLSAQPPAPGGVESQAPRTLLLGDVGSRPWLKAQLACMSPQTGARTTAGGAPGQCRL